MQSYMLTKYGKPSVLKIQNQPLPDVNPGEILVKIQSIGINYAEVQSRKGLYQWSPKLPYTLGMEAFGIVESIGDGVTTHQIGQPVIVANQIGCYSEYVCVPSVQALPAIPDYTPEENAAFSVSFMTAWVALMEMARLRPSDTVLIHAAAGGLGTAAVQLAKKFDCTVFGTVGSDEKMDLVKQLGADAVINYRKDDFVTKIKALNDQKGLDVVLEVVGGDVFRNSMKALNPFGRTIVMGFASLNLNKWNPFSWYRTWKAIPKVNVSNLAVHSSGILASHLGYLLRSPEHLIKVWSELSAFVSQHGIRPVVGHTFGFDELPAAHTLMESRKSTGKIVINV